MVFGQTEKATLTGSITDGTHAAITGAAIHLKSVESDRAADTVSNAAGAYTISGLPVGRYVETVTTDGFDTVKFEPFTFEVGQTRTLNVALQPKRITTQISVEEAAPPIDLSSAQIGSVVKGSQTQDLPLNGRSWVRLLTLVPGAIDAGSGTEDQVRFAGLSQEDNNFRFDGVDATGINHQFEKVDLRLQLSTEAIAEFRASSALFSADQGGSAGGQVDLVSKSGTNAFHGLLGSSCETACSTHARGTPRLFHI